MGGASDAVLLLFRQQVLKLLYGVLTVVQLVLQVERVCVALGFISHLTAATEPVNCFDCVHLSMVLILVELGQRLRLSLVQAVAHLHVKIQEDEVDIEQHEQRRRHHVQLLLFLFLFVIIGEGVVALFATASKHLLKNVTYHRLVVEDGQDDEVNEQDQSRTLMFYRRQDECWVVREYALRSDRLIVLIGSTALIFQHLVIF